MTRDHWHGLLRFGPCLEDTDGTLAEPPPAEPCRPRGNVGAEMTRLMQGAALATLDLANAALLIWIFAHGTLARAVLLDYPR